jgi:hypothetical protein
MHERTCASGSHVEPQHAHPKPRIRMIVHALSRSKLPLVAVCSYGRTGSTVYMKLLRSMGLNVEGEVPFEDRTLQVAFIKWLEGQVGRAGDATGPVNLASFAKNTYKSEVAASWSGEGSFEEQVSGWLARLHAAGKRGVAEKFIGSAVLRIMKSFDDGNAIRSIFLLRDPRDVFISIKQFNEKRGFAGFADAGDDQKLFNVICSFMREQLQLQRRFGGLVARYEDLMINPRRTIHDTVRLFSTEAVSVKFVDEAYENFSQVTTEETAHMTSESSEDSLERWRHPDFSQFAAIFDAAKTTIAEIGYPV